jgi:type IV fimbrial biogenesis protein FimT
MSPVLPRTTRAGFSAIELMVTISILAILLAIAAPSLTRFIKDVRLAGQANDLLTDLMLARSEAVKRDVPVAICGKANNNDTQCGSDPNWQGGWLLVIDADKNGKRDSATSDTLLKSEEALHAKSTLKATGAGNKGAITFAPTGINVSGPITLTLCDNEGYGRIIDVTAQGRASVVKVDAKKAPNEAACPTFN